jgi:regulatory protein
MYESAPGDALIDAIRPSGNSGVLWRVSVSSDELGVKLLGVARIDRSVIDAFGLSVGTAWTQTLADAMLEAAHAGEARRYAINALGMRSMSAGRLIENMSRRGTPKPIACRVVADLEATGLVDDRAMAEMIGRSILSRNPAGARVIEQRLRARAIRPEIAREVAHLLTGDRDQTADAVRVARKKLRSMSDRVAPDARQRRLLGSLARRGFAPGVCRDVVRRVLAEDPDEASRLS